MSGNYIDTAFASSGDLTTIPSATQPDGSVSFTQGYGPDYGLPPSSPGKKNPERAKMNYILNLLSKGVQQYQRYGTPEFITAGDNGGTSYPYAFLARVRYNNLTYVSLKHNNTDLPTVRLSWKQESQPRTILTQDETYYVATTGNDTTGVGTVGSPWATIQHAVQYVTTFLDTSGYVANIQVADGTYSAGSITVGHTQGTLGIRIIGNDTTPSNVVINSTGAPCFTTYYGVGMYLSGVKLVATGAPGLYVAQSGFLAINKIEFGSCANGHIRCSDAGSYTILQNSYTISGGGLNHLYAENGGQIIHTPSKTVTITGTPAFTNGFAQAYGCATITAQSITYSGSATGKRYDAQLNGVVNSYGGGANYFPGNSAGTTSTGGQYV